MNNAQNESLAKLNLTKEEIPQKVVAIFEDLTLRDDAVKASRAKANEAKDKAQALKEKDYPFFGKKKAEIEDLQEVVLALGNAQVDSATAENELLIYQDKLAEASRYLFGIGIAGLAANRMVIRELELKLKNASQEQLSSLAIKELESVLRQLKAQEDTYIRLEKQKETLEEHDKLLNQKADVSQLNDSLSKTEHDICDRFNKKVEQVEMESKSLNLSIKNHSDKLVEHDKLLNQKANVSQLNDSLSKTERDICDRFNKKVEKVEMESKSMNLSIKKHKIIMTAFIVISLILSSSALILALIK